MTISGLCRAVGGSAAIGRAALACGLEPGSTFGSTSRPHPQLQRSHKLDEPGKPTNVNRS